MKGQDGAARRMAVWIRGQGHLTPDYRSPGCYLRRFEPNRTNETVPQGLDTGHAQATLAGWCPAELDPPSGEWTRQAEPGPAVLLEQRAGALEVDHGDGFGTNAQDHWMLRLRRIFDSLHL